MRIGLATSKCDDGYKLAIETELTKLGYEIVDFNKEGYDIVEISKNICKSVVSKEIEKAIIINEDGILPFIICTKHKNIVCAPLSDEHSSKMTRDHNNTSIITLGYNVIGKELAKNISVMFAKSDYAGGRHQVRIDMLNKM